MGQQQGESGAAGAGWARSAGRTGSRPAGREEQGLCRIRSVGCCALPAWRSGSVAAEVRRQELGRGSDVAGAPWSACLGKVESWSDVAAEDVVVRFGMFILENFLKIY